MNPGLAVVWAVGLWSAGADWPAGVRWPVANDDITFHVSFDRADLQPDRAVNPADVRVEGTPRFAPGLRGQALVMGGPQAATAVYPLVGHLDLDRPGAVSLWVYPEEWPYGADEPIVRFWTTAYSSRGFFGLQRQGLIVKDGLLRRTANLHFYIHYFAGIPARCFDIGPPQLPLRRWHLMVIQWHGRRWEGWLDRGPAAAVELPRPLRMKELAGPLLVGGDRSAWITRLDELTIYRRPLTPAEIIELYEEGLAASSQPSATRPCHP